ncbi:MAG: hypothetical protein LBD04_03025 [Synergistaceae bacterium]|jgi:ABC-type Na+ efflux pump permease subunit|nr:hypothetical protein [Synergistaceae bacterium]
MENNKNTMENDVWSTCCAKLGGWKGKAVAVVLFIIVLNVMWSMMKSEVDVVRQDAAARLTKLEAEAAKRPESIDLAELRTEVASIKEAAGSFEAKLNAVIKAEEDKLERLEKDAANQRAYIEGLKSLLSGKTINK